ncbi:spermidine/putrescine ABC transporter substrate-binding protein [Sandarakinorhabdus sp.]|uniref:ABC transporter substrate-binding protein n=1 Tax=Sandarakinorhabdus sp. TaxID=1916663 RepID=UPI00333F2EAE
MPDLSRPLSRRGFGGLAAALVLDGCARQWPTGANGEEARLNFYNWDTYTGESTLADFQAASGVEVRMSLYANNDELFARLRAGNPGFDVIVPSNEFVTRLQVSDLLMPLDHGRLPNLANIGPEYMNVAYDPARRWSMPYTWLALGIGYRKSRVDGVPDSWKWVLDSPRYSGRIGLFAESDDLIRLGAKYLGHSVNAVTPAIMDQVARMLIAQKQHVKLFHHDEGQDLLAAGEIDLVVEYNGDIAQVIADDDDLAFVVPREGTLINSDCLCIPAGAPRPDNAHRFINFLLDAQVSAEISRTIRYPTPNAAALALMPEEYRSNRVIFPRGPAMARSEYGSFQGIGHIRAVEEAITRVMAA